MVFLDHVQNLHIHAEKTHKDFGAHCMKYVNFVHDPEKQYRSTVPAVRPLSIGLQVTEVLMPPSGRAHQFFQSARTIWELQAQSADITTSYDVVAFRIW